MHGYLQLKDDSIHKTPAHPRHACGMCCGILGAGLMIVLCGIAPGGLSQLSVPLTPPMLQEKAARKDQSGVDNLVSILRGGSLPGIHPGSLQPGFRSKFYHSGQDGQQGGSYRPEKVSWRNIRGITAAASENGAPASQTGMTPTPIGIDPAAIPAKSRQEEEDDRFEAVDWLGFAPLYLVSAIPVFIGACILWTLWVTSFH